MTESWRRSTRFGWLAGAIGVAVLAYSLVTFNDHSIAQNTAARVQSSPGSFADVIEDVSPAVVNITVRKVEPGAPTVFQFSAPPGLRGRELPFGDFFERFFEDENGRVPQRRSEGQGSGFIIDSSGYIVTNNHVAGDAEQITVTLHDGREFDAMLIGRDARTDLALIKIDASGLAAVAFGNSDSARVGDWVVAIGNPFGLGGTATAGIISARGRDGRAIRDNDDNDYLQLDAPINFGNSGGPVFNTAGQVVGVNTAIFSPNGGNIGIGFAIPSNQVREIVAELRENGSVERGWLGVQIQEIDEDLAASLGLNSTRGALVTSVVDDSPAAKGGVQAGDVVTRFNGQEIDSPRALSRSVASAPPSRPAQLTVWRDGRTRELTVELGEVTEGEPVAATSSPTPGQSGSGALGLTLQRLTDEDRTQLGIPRSVEGALVTNVLPGSTAAEKGIRAGDVITRVNQRAVASVADAIAALNAAKENGERALLLVRRGDSQRFVALSFQ
jgi:serine protease Do